MNTVTTRVAMVIAFLSCGLAARAGTPADARATVAQLTLEQAVSLAVARDERARSAGANAEAAAHRLARARAFFFPELNLAATLTRRPFQVVRQLGDGSEVVIQRYNALSGIGNIRVPLFNAGAFPLYRQARLAQEAAALSAAEQQRLIGYEAADAFLMVLGTEEVVRAAERRRVFSQDRLRDAEARVLAGLVSSNDVTRNELEVATAERQLVVASNSAALARLELSYLLVADIRGSLVEPTALLQVAAGANGQDATNLVDKGRQDRLDVRAGEKQVEALRESAREPRRRALPTLDLLGEARYTNEAGFTGRNVVGFAAVTATWPLFDGGERYAEAREREALARAAALDQVGRRRNVALEVRRALVALDSARATQTAAQTAATVAARHADETAELYRQGLTGALEVADANLRRFEAEVTLVQDRYALLLAYLDLQAAIGEEPPGRTR